jgi:hypothetical protein
MPRPPHSSRFYHLQKLGEEYRSWSSSLCSFLHSPLTLSLLGTNILLNTLSLRSSLNVSDQVSHSYKTTGKILVLYTVIFQFLDSKLEDSVPNDSMHSLTSICSNFFLNITLICRWVDNIRMDLQEVGCGYVDCIGLAQDRDRWRTLMSAVMNLPVA